jgi:aminoglycoside phosphotransferase (APT) family kinase protein
MSKPWEAERLVSPELARALLEDQFPELAPAVVEPLGAGWDNTAYLVNQAYVFRFPRRPIAVDLITRETRVLPRIASQLPLAVPVHAYVGAADERFGWPFVGYPMLPGRTACAAALDERERFTAAESLARFLAVLHAIPTAGLDLPGDEIGRLDLSRRLPETRERLDEIGRLGLVADIHPLLQILEHASAAPPPHTGVLVHGDIYALHLLVDDNRHVTGVIDWGDVHVGDPAVDLAVAHSFLPPSAHPAFLAAYGAVENSTWHLARWRAVHHSAAITVYAYHTGSADLLREALLALSHIVTAPRSAARQGRDRHR